MGWYSSYRRDKLTGSIFSTPKPEGKKIKEVYDNEGLIHTWASGNVPRGRSSTMFFENGVIYSFGHHYKAAKIYTNAKGEKLVLINQNGYSPTTRKHLYLIRSATSHLNSIEVPNVDVIIDHAANVKFLQDKITDRMAGIMSMKGWHGNGDSLFDNIEELNTYLRFFKLKGEINLESKNLQETGALLNEMYQAKELRAKKMRETREKNEEIKFRGIQVQLNSDYSIKVNDFLKNKITYDELLKFEYRRVPNGVTFGNVRYKHLHAKMHDSLKEAFENKIAEINADRIKAWRDGTLTRLPWNVRLEYALLRVRGETVETSQGADVPLSHALRLLNLIEKKQVRKGERVGHYTLESVESLKDVPPVVTIGCHKILLSEAQTVLAPYREGVT